MKKLVFLTALICISLNSFSQSFIPAFDRFSGKLVSYVYLEDGTTIEGTIDDLDRKKGLIEEITILPTGAKKKRKLEPKEIKTMYLPATAVDKLSNLVDNVGNTSKFADRSVNMDVINKGYAYFEKVKVKVKRSEEDLLMQIVNPSFSSKIKVFFDPKAKEGMGLSVGAIKVVGGEDKSYFVQVGNGIAKKITKKDYEEEEYKNLFSGCSDLMKKLEVKHSWNDFDKNLYEFTTACN